MAWGAFVHTCAQAVRTTGAILFVIASAAYFGWLLAYLQVPAASVEFLTGLTQDSLAENLDIDAHYVHNLSVATFSNGNVYSSVRTLTGAFAESTCASAAPAARADGSAAT